MQSLSFLQMPISGYYQCELNKIGCVFHVAMRTLPLNIAPPKRLLNSTLRFLSDRYPVSNLKRLKLLE